MESGRLYYITSAQAPNKSNFQYTMTLDNDFDSVVVLQASIPISYYMVQDGYDSFILRENGVNTTITINEGNYNANTFLTTIINLLNASSPN